MVTSGPPRKPAAERKGHRTYETTTLVPRNAGSIEVPALAEAKDMLAVTRKAWADFWQSPVAGVVVQGSDLPALTRMFHLADEFERCRREFRKSHLVKGSQGQAVINPLGPLMLALSKEVRALEDRFGASVVSRLRLSIDLGSAQTSLEQLNARMLQDTAESADDDQPPQHDPRLGQIIDIAGGAAP